MSSRGEMGPGLHRDDTSGYEAIRHGSSAFGAPYSLSSPQIVVHQRHVADALAGRGEDRVEDRRGGDRNRRLTDTAPEIAGRHDDGLDLRHLVDPHHVVAVEIGLLDCAVRDSALA